MNWKVKFRQLSFVGCMLYLVGCSDDVNPVSVRFELNSANISHLLWPFYNSQYPEDFMYNIPSKWEGQIEGAVLNDAKRMTTWRYQNDHIYLDNEPTHHLYADWFSQDWNYFEGGNSDCGMPFFAPLSGQVIRIDRVCINAEADCESPACDPLSSYIYGNQIYILHQANESNFVFRAAHFNSINDQIQLDQWIEAGQLIGQIGNEGKSTTAHVHASLWKDIGMEVLNQLKQGAIDLPPDLNITGDSYAADFLFDAIEQ